MGSDSGTGQDRKTYDTQHISVSLFPLSLAEEYDAITPTTATTSSSTDGHGRRSIEEQADSVAPLIGLGKFSQSSSTTRRMLVATHSDADSAVSMVSV